MKRRVLSSLLPVVSLLYLSLGACTHKTEGEHTAKASHVHEEHAQEAKKHDAHSAHWAYEGESGPANWAGLCSEFATCGGESQSPIDIVADSALTDNNLADIGFSYMESGKLDVVNNGHTIKVAYANGSSAIFGDAVFSLKQFHFHCPSENTFKGKAFPMEVHLVHLNDAGEISVIGIMIKEGAENPFFTAFWDKLPATEGEKVSEDLAINATNLLPAEKAYYHFSGSLTTPPCTEGVNWYVLKTPIEASAGQIAKIKGLMPANNARPTQPLNGRLVASTQ